MKTILLAFAVSPEERAAFEQRFFAEARVAARLHHPGIVVVHDVGRDEASGTLFIAFEHLEGRTLAQVAQAGALPWREALRIAKEAALALQHAHAQGIVHRDIKPANIMLTPAGEAKIMDFGIAKVPASQLTAAGQVFGTPANMSPEQAQGDPLDARSDLFSLGTVLYQLLTGKRAFGGESVPQILYQVLSTDPPPPSRVVAGIPDGADYVVARLIAKDSAARYASGQQAAEDIDDVLAGRTPRHRAGWAHAPSAPPSASAETTLVAALRETAPLPPAPALTAATLTVARTPAPPPHASGRRSRATFGIVAFAVVGATVALLARLSREAPETAPGGQQSAKVVIDFEHSLKDGNFKLWLDDQLAVDADLSGRVAKQILGLKLRKGTLEQVLDVPPGSHQLRVSVAWEGNQKEQSTRARFEPGATLKLEVRLGRLLKDLSLKWK